MTPDETKIQNKKISLAKIYGTIVVVLLIGIAILLAIIANEIHNLNSISSLA